jgi:hypothetical protein
MLRVDTGTDEIGCDPDTGAYHAHDDAHVLPQIGWYSPASPCDPAFSLVSVDRTTSVSE